MKNLIIFLAILISITTITLDYRNSNAQWVQRYSSPGNYYSDWGQAIAFDDSGNVYAAGISQLMDGSECECVLIKYSSSGIQQWIQIYSGAAHFDCLASVAVDEYGNAYVTGFERDSFFQAKCITIKYNSTGSLEWIQRYSVDANQNALGHLIAIDHSGIYVTGYCFGPGISGDTFFTIKYNSNGDSLWVRLYNGTPSDMAIDGSGNIYVAGQSKTANFDDDYLLIKYNSSGDLQWVKKYNGPGNGNDVIKSLTVDGSGNSYVTGNSYGIGANGDYATIKYSSNGDLLWVKRYNGPGNGWDQAYSVKADNTGNVYITGSSDANFVTIKYNSSGVQQWIQRFNGEGGSMGIDGEGNIYVNGVSHNSSSDITTIKYNSSGVMQWALIYDSGSNDYLNSMKVDNSGNVYIAGTYQGIETGDDILTIKYSTQQTTLNLTSLIEGFYNNVINKMVKDTMRVYLRQANSPYSIVDSAKSVLDSNGYGNFYFHNAVNGYPYYISIKHRNSIETWSRQTTMFTGNQLNYDFTSAADKAYGNNLVLKGVKYCIYSGDINQDGSIDLNDFLQIYNDAMNNVSGYVNTDLNGDNYTDLSDLTLSFNNAQSFVGIMKP